MDNNYYINKFKMKINKMSYEFNRLYQKLQIISSEQIYISNIFETYRNKVFEIENMLLKQSINLWDDDFILRDAIMVTMDLKTEEAKNILSDAADRLSKMPTIAIADRNLNKLPMMVIKPKINKFNKINESISNYNIMNNLKETLLTYYNDIPIEIYRPGDFNKSYIKMKKCIEQIGLDISLKEQEQDILNLISNKEKQCLEYHNNNNNKQDAPTTIDFLEIKDNIQDTKLTLESIKKYNNYNEISENVENSHKSR